MVLRHGMYPCRNCGQRRRRGSKQPGVQPWVDQPRKIQAPDGAAENQRTNMLLPPPGLNAFCHLNPRLTSWAIIGRCSAACFAILRLGVEFPKTRQGLARCAAPCGVPPKPALSRPPADSFPVPLAKIREAPAGASQRDVLCLKINPLPAPGFAGDHRSPVMDRSLPLCGFLGGFFGVVGGLGVAFS